MKNTPLIDLTQCFDTNSHDPVLVRREMTDRLPRIARRFVPHPTAFFTALNTHKAVIGGQSI